MTNALESALEPVAVMVAKIPPDGVVPALTVHNTAVLSAAISLKRIADVLTGDTLQRGFLDILSGIEDAQRERAR